MVRSRVYVTQETAAKELLSLLAQVRAGAEVIIEDAQRPVALLRAAPGAGRRLSEMAEMPEARGSTATLDGDFGRDLDEIIRSRTEPLPEVQTGRRSFLEVARSLHLEGPADWSTSLDRRPNDDTLQSGER